MREEEKNKIYFHFFFKKTLQNKMPNMSKLIDSPIPPKIFIATKQWIYEISEKVSRSHAEGNIITLFLRE